MGEEGWGRDRGMREAWVILFDNSLCQFIDYTKLIDVPYRTALSTVWTGENATARIQIRPLM